MAIEMETGATEIELKKTKLTYVSVRISSRHDKLVENYLLKKKKLIGPFQTSEENQSYASTLNNGGKENLENVISNKQ